MTFRKTLSNWLTNWRRKPNTSPLPLGLTETEVLALRALRSTAHWKHYEAVLERLGEQQAATLASGLPHDKYLFTSGAITALYRVFRLVDDLITATEKFEALTNDRTTRDRARNARYASTFVNTPWYDSWRDAASVESASRK